MSDFMKMYFGPLDLKPEYCLYFYYLSVVCFVFSVIFSLGLVGLVFSKYRSNKWGLVLNSITLVLSTVFSYFANRVLYTMCMSSATMNKSSHNSPF